MLTALLSGRIYLLYTVYTFQPGGGVSEGTLKTYCWMYSSFNIPEQFQGKCARRRQSEDVMYNSYYQWVALCLVGQVRLFNLRHDRCCLLSPNIQILNKLSIICFFRRLFFTCPEQFGCHWKVCRAVKFKF